MAGPTSQETEALRGVVLSSFSTILSGDQQQRKDAEEELRALEVTEGFGLRLSDIKTRPLPSSFRFWACPRRDHLDG